MSEAYRAAGVDLELGDELSQMLYEASKLTWQNRAGRFGEPQSSTEGFRSFRNMRIAPFLYVPDPDGIDLYLFDDGVGTKVEVAQRMRKHDTVAFDLLAMVVDDAAIRGYEPAAVSTTLDVRRLKAHMKPEMEQLARGYVLAAAAARIALVNGEVAELGELVGYWNTMYPPGEDRESLSYNWSATLLAAGHKDRLLDGSAVRAGDALVGFKEEGFRSNGLSLVRRTLGREYGFDWHRRKATFSEDKTFGELVLQPSTIYSPILVDAIGGYDLSQPQQAEVHGAAHITGGGIPGKLRTLLRVAGVGAVISEPFDPPEIMNRVQGFAGIDDREAYNVWNMGNGMIVATPEPEKLVEIARRHSVEARQIGEVVSGNTITIAGPRVDSDIVFDLNN